MAPNLMVGVGYRIPLLVIGMFTLLLGIAGGLARIGWGIPLPRATHAAWHGALMIGGFFGTVISLERAIALARPWAYAAPIAAAIGALALWLGLSWPWNAWLQVIAAALLAVVTVAVVLRQPALHTATLLVAAACWFTGALAWALGGSVEPAILLWLTFLVLTIAGERLELTRLLPRSEPARIAFIAIVVLLLVAALVGGAAARVFAGIALFALALWLMRFDIARRTVREPELTGFIGASLLSGYVWLAVGGAALAIGAHPDRLFMWDAGLHAVLLGFVFSMVIGHAPVIFPAVLGRPMRYHWNFYIPLAALHASVALRLAGDLIADMAWRRAGGAANAVAIVLFLIGTVVAVVRGRRIN